MNRGCFSKLIRLSGITLAATLVASITGHAEWLTGWAYRVPLDISSPSGDEVTDYPVMVTLDGSFDFSKPMAGGDDLRVTEEDGVTPVSFWIEIWDAINESAVVWAKAPVIPPAGTTLCLYYGNPGATPASDGDATFTFFEDDWDQFSSGSGNPVHSAGQPWWEVSVSYPIVFEDSSFPERPRFHMLYDGHYVIGHAKGYAWSDDLIHWTEYDAGAPHPPNPNPVMGTGYPGNAPFAWGDVIKVGGTYLMYVSRGPGQIYRTQSTDLITWTDFQPITGGSFGTGAALLKEGDGITPIVVDGRYWMVYFPTGSPGSMNLASADAAGNLVAWEPWAGNPLLTPTAGGWDQSGLWTPSWVRLGDSYYIYYQGNGPAGWETGFARADAYDGGGSAIRPDTASWSKSDPDDDGDPDPVITNGPAGSWDSSYCIDPTIREFDGVYYVFYTGNSANGFATSSSPAGPWTKYMGDPPAIWQVLGSPTAANGFLTLGSHDGVQSSTLFQFMSVGFRARFASLLRLVWGGFISGSTGGRVLVETTRTDENLYLKTFATAERTALLAGDWLGEFHTYELTWRSGLAGASVNHGASMAALIEQVPSDPLPLTFHNYEDPEAVLEVDWAYVRQGSAGEPAVVIGPEETAPGEGTVSAMLTCVPSSGTVPFLTSMSVSLNNLHTGLTRRLAGRIDLRTANGSFYSNWRSGYANVGPGASYTTSWNQNIPASGAMIGDNVFTLSAEDVTPSPYNLPPYPPSGDTDTAAMTIVAFSP